MDGNATEPAGWDGDLFGAPAPEEFSAAREAIRFVLDGLACFARVDGSLRDVYGAEPLAGEPFDASRLVPAHGVRAALAIALEGRKPERRFVLFPTSAEREAVWALDAWPVSSLQLAHGKGVAVALTRCDPDTGRESLDEMLFDVTLAERLARERLGTSRAVIATLRHEVSNALTTIIGNSELILRRSAEVESSLVQRIQEIHAQGRRIQDVIDRFQSLKDVSMIMRYGDYELVELDEERAKPESGDGDRENRLDEPGKLL